MALSSSTLWEIRSTGSDSNAAGGFNPGNANFPTDGTVDANTGNTASPVFSSASYNFVAGDVGAWLFVKSGTNTLPGWYQIASVASNKATLSAAIGAAVRHSGNVPAFTNTAVGIATVGTPTSITWGIDYSQQASARISFSDMVIDGTTNTKFTSAGNPVGKNFVGNLIRVTGGIGFTTQYVEVVSTVTTTATCDKSLGTLSSTGGTGYLGGAFATCSPFTATAPEFTAGFRLYIAAGATYSHSTQIRLRTTCYLFGYDTLRTTIPTTRPILQSTFAGTMIGTDGLSPYDIRLYNLDCDGQGVTSTSVLSQVSGTAALAWVVQNCIIRRFTANGLNTPGSNSGTLLDSQVYSNGAIGVAADGNFVTARNCIIRDNGGPGLGGNNSNGNVTAINCAFARNTHGINCYAVTVDDCTFHSNSLSGLGPSLAGNIVTLNAVRNCIFWGQSNYGIAQSAVPGGDYQYQNSVYYGIAMGSNTSGNYQNLNAPRLGAVTLTVDPCVDATNNNFALNNTAGGGAACRGVGYPGALGGSTTTTGYVDLGAVQHQDSGGTSTTFVSVNRRRIVIQPTRTERRRATIIPQVQLQTSYVPLLRSRVVRTTQERRRDVSRIIPQPQLLPIVRRGRDRVVDRTRRNPTKIISSPTFIPLASRRREVRTITQTRRTTHCVQLPQLVLPGVTRRRFIPSQQRPAFTRLLPITTTTPLASRIRLRNVPVVQRRTFTRLVPIATTTPLAARIRMRQVPAPYPARRRELAAVLAPVITQQTVLVTSRRNVR